MKPNPRKIKIENKPAAKATNKALDNLFSQFNEIVSSNKSKISTSPDRGVKRKRQSNVRSEENEFKVDY